MTLPSMCEKEEDCFHVECGKLAREYNVRASLPSSFRASVNVLANTLSYPQVDTRNLLEHVRTYIYDDNAT